MGDHTPPSPGGLEDYLLSASCLMELNAFAQRHAYKFEDVGPCSPRHAPCSRGAPWGPLGAPEAEGPLPEGILKGVIHQASEEDNKGENKIE